MKVQIYRERGRGRRVYATDHTRGATMKVQIYRAADAKRHADKVAAAAMRAGIPRIVADNGNAYVDIEPCP